MRKVVFIYIVLSIISCGTAKIDKNMGIYNETHTKDSLFATEALHKTDSSYTLSEQYKDSLVESIHRTIMEEWETRVLEWTDTNGITYKESYTKGMKTSGEDVLKQKTKEGNTEQSSATHKKDSTNTSSRITDNNSITNINEEYHKKTSKGVLRVGDFLGVFILGMVVGVIVLLKRRKSG